MADVTGIMVGTRLRVYMLLRSDTSHLHGTICEYNGNNVYSIFATQVLSYPRGVSTQLQMTLTNKPHTFPTGRSPRTHSNDYNETASKLEQLLAG